MAKSPELDALCARYPLPGGFCLRESFCEELSIERMQLGMVGLVAESDGVQAIGSAAGAGGHPWARAYYELLERVAVFLARAEETRVFATRDPDSGEPLGRLSHSQVFGDVHASEDHACADQQTRAAMSNGVALHGTWRRAAIGARRELAERDGVLASWWREAPVVPVPLPDNPSWASLGELYELAAYQLGDGGSLGLPAAGLFAFPRGPQSPMVYGFGAGDSVAEAVEAASAEALQRLAFLWGEEIPTSAPEASPTPDFHQEFFLVPAHRSLLRDWLADHAQASAGHVPVTAGAGEQAAQVTHVDLTPPELSGRLWVAKALASSTRQLRFGPQPVRRGRVVPAAWRVHPVV